MNENDFVLFLSAGLLPLFMMEIFQQHHLDVTGLYLTQICSAQYASERTRKERKEPLAFRGKMCCPPASSVHAAEFSISVWIRLSGT